MSGNVETARQVLELATRLGVRDYCLCGGSRNAPFLAIVGASTDLRRFAFADERSAAFFALGRARATGRPVAVVTTSGTAVAEMLPPTVEAFYSGTPLVLITADRPRRFRGTGAPQAIEQRGIFGEYALLVDLESGEEIPAITWSQTTPLHINVAFDEPLIDGEIVPCHPEPIRLASLAQGKLHEGSGRRPRGSRHPDPSLRLGMTLRQWQRPLVILGALQPHERDAVRQFALTYQAPVYAEPLSGLREDESLPTLKSGERILRQGGFDGVLRIGGVPTLRFWRDLDESLRDLPVVHVSALPFPGMSRGSLIQGDISQTLETPKPRVNDALLRRDREFAAQFEQILEAEPASELSMIRALSQILPDRSHIYLGNSLPIREWDLAASRKSRQFEYSANRGANGIDGQISTFFGLCRPDMPNWCIVGDLTAMYDLSAPWIVNQLEGATEFVVVIINNGGGRIFARVPSLRTVDPAVREKFFEDEHAFHFDSWARMWNLDYEQWTEVPSKAPRMRRGIIELLPDPEASRRIWSRYDALWASE